MKKSNTIYEHTPVKHKRTLTTTASGLRASGWAAGRGPSVPQAAHAWASAEDRAWAWAAGREQAVQRAEARGARRASEQAPEPQPQLAEPVPVPHMAQGSQHRLRPAWPTLVAGTCKHHHRPQTPETTRPCASCTQRRRQQRTMLRPQGPKPPFPLRGRRRPQPRRCCLPPQSQVSKTQAGAAEAAEAAAEFPCTDC
jgi:hypothetical protein